MKKKLLESYIEGVRDRTCGERYRSLFSYLFPEIVTALLIYSVPYWIDAYFISHLDSTAYPTLGGVNNLLHFFIKLAEGFSVSTIIVSGQLRGRNECGRVGPALSSLFWTTASCALVLSALLYWGAPAILQWYAFPPEMLHIGVPFLRLRALSIVFIFSFFVFVGFLRGVKNTRIPMLIYAIGSVIFVACDYLFIFGASVIPTMGLSGSALASSVQYASMLCMVIGYTFWGRRYAAYDVGLFKHRVRLADVWSAIRLGWPLIVDKAIMAGAYVWLGKMLCPMGKCWISTFCVVKDMERFAFLPAIAGAQVVTFLVSNDYGAEQWKSIKNNIKKVVLVSSIIVLTVLGGFVFWQKPVIALFDRTGEFTPLAERVFPWLSVLVFFDLLQLILSGALRGAGDVKTVMFVRLFVCLGCFVPVSYLLAHSSIGDPTLRFLLVYGAFYVGNGIMSMVYIARFRGDGWKAASRVS